jgi:tetratricopeptide (TPR) repeat protein
VLSLIVFGAGFLIFSKKPVSAEREFTHPDIPGMPPGQSPDMEKILATLPGDYDELVNLGNHYMDNGIYALAIECYRRALAIDSTDPNVMVDLGACSHAVGNLAEAIAFFKKALQLDPDHAIAHFNLGIAYTGLGEMNEARKHWKKYVEIAPESPLADTVRKYIENLDN